MTNTSLILVESDAVVVSMKRAGVALEEARTIQQTKKILDVAAAAEIYARRQHLSAEAESIAVSIKVEALRKLGEMLRATPKAKGELLRGTKSEPRETGPEKLSDLGLTKKESAVAQKLASLPDAEFQQVREGHVTVAKAIAAVTEAKAKPAAPAKTERQIEADRIAEEAHGDVDIVAELEQAHREIETLQAIVAAGEADDQRAEAMKWLRAYHNAVRQQSEAMDRAAQAVKREAFSHRQLMRCGKALGVEDPDKIAPAVEAFVRQYRKAA